MSEQHTVPITSLIEEINQLRLERKGDQDQQQLEALRSDLARALLGQVAR